MTETTEVIYFNGKRYNSIREMPPKVRKQYEQLERLLADADADGTPDIFQPRSFSDLKTAVHLAIEVGKMQQSANAKGADATRMALIRETEQGIYVNGKFYETPEDMPQDVYEIYDAAINSAAEPRISPGDDVWFDEENFNPRGHPAIPESDMPNQSVDTTSRFFTVLILALLFLGAVILAWMFLF